MNSDRRHELQQNDLAAYLGRINRSIEPYSRLIAVAVTAVIVGVIGLSVYFNSSSESKSDATFELIQASGSSDAEVLRTVADKYPEAPAAAWSRLYEGNQHLGEGMQAMFTSRIAATEKLELATAAFQDALDRCDETLLQSRAHFGIARAAEASGNVPDAIAAYKLCIAVNESAAMTKKAQDRIDSLSTTETIAFLDWFSDQDFSNADPSLPPSLPGGGTLPDMPTIDLPPLAVPDSEGDPETEGDPDMDDQPVDGEEETATTTESEAPPKKDEPAKPAESDKPAKAVEPADAKPATKPKDAEPSADEGDSATTDSKATASDDATGSDKEPVADEPAAVKPEADATKSDDDSVAADKAENDQE